MKCDHAVQLFTCCICGCTAHLPVGCLEVFLQATATCPNSEKKTPIVRAQRMLRIPIARLPMGLVPLFTTMTKLLAGWPASLTKLSAGFPATLCGPSSLCSGQPRSRILRFLRIVVFFVLLVNCEGRFCGLAGSLPGARRAIVCILFSLEQSQLVN